MKTLLVYLPFTYPTISTRVFKSFLDLINSKIEGIEIKTFISNTFPLDRNRNEAVDLACSTKYSADYIFFADGDNIWPKNTLSTLLAAVSDEFPVVSGLYWRKVPPYACIQGMYGDNEQQKNRWETIKSMGFIDKNGQQCLFYTPLRDFDIQRPIDVSGMGCLLVRTDVFKKIELPYFAYHNAYSLGGDFSIDHASEEMTFFMKLHNAGIKTLLVPSIRCGHEVTKVIGSPEEQ